MGPPILTWLHFGDLHITTPGEANHRDLISLIDAANHHLAGRIDFALLPGDNADQGTDAQFLLVREAVDALEIPLHMLPGDHDFHSRSLDAFYGVLGAERLPKVERIKGIRCLFLDVVSAGTGGPDFRLTVKDLDWLRSQLEAAESAQESSVIFMHTYPADLREGGEALRGLLEQHHVACVDMGHTHYNELANDGRTIFMATRSTGQIEEGPVGFSVAAIDGGVVSWRFKPLGEAWPLVLITSPADHRLIIDPASPDQLVRRRLRIAAKVWGVSDPLGVVASIDEGPAIPMMPDGRDTALWCAVNEAPLAEGLHRITVTAREPSGLAASETLEFLVNPRGHYDAPLGHRDGSDRAAIGHWPQKHLLGSQLGPNRNGRKW